MGHNDPHVTGPQQLQGRRQQSVAVLTTISGCALITEGVPESSLLTREITGPLRLKAEGFVNLTPVPARLFFSLCRVLRCWRDPSTKHRSLYSRIKHVKCNAAGVKVSIVEERGLRELMKAGSHTCAPIDTVICQNYMKLTAQFIIKNDVFNECIQYEVLRISALEILSSPFLLDACMTLCFYLTINTVQYDMVM